MGENMLMADIGLVANAMTVLNVEPGHRRRDHASCCMENSDGLDGPDRHQRRRPAGSAARATPTASAVNTKMAHQAVEEEFQKLADSLREYSGRHPAVGQRGA